MFVNMADESDRAVVMSQCQSLFELSQTSSSSATLWLHQRIVIANLSRDDLNCARGDQGIAEDYLRNSYAVRNPLTVTI